MVLSNHNGHCASLSDIGGTSCRSRLTGHREPLLSGVPKLFEHPLNVDVDHVLSGALETGLHVRQAGPRQKGMNDPHSDLHAHLGNRGNISSCAYQRAYTARKQSAYWRWVSVQDWFVFCNAISLSSTNNLSAYSRLGAFLKAISVRWHRSTVWG